MKKKLLFLAFLFFNYSLFATDIFVDQSAPAGGDGSSWASAFQDIQSAINIAVADDTIFIAAGIYRPEDTLEVSVPLNFRGGYPAGGGVQNIDANITQIQADFDTGNLLFEVLDIDPDAATSLTGLRFANCRRAISTASNLSINQLQFDQVSGNAIRLQGTFDFCLIENSLFTNFSDDIISGSSVDLQNFDIRNTIFQNSTDRAISLNDDVANFTMTDCIIRDFNNNTATISLDTSNATITNLLAEDNISSSGSLLSLRDGTLRLEESVFTNNSGASGAVCLQASDSTIEVDNSIFSNNTATATGPKSVFLINDCVFTVTNSSFTNNHADGTFSALADIRADDTDALSTFDNCYFYQNSTLGSSQQGIIDASYDTTLLINNCVFDANSVPGQYMIDSFAGSGATITNNIFRNHAVGPGVLGIDYVERGLGGGIRIEGNTFINNVNNSIDLGRMTDFIARDNRYYGDVGMELDRIPNGQLINEYFEGNSNGTRILEVDDINLTITNTVMVSTLANGTHTLIDAGNDSALEIINSTFTATDINDTHVRIDFDDDLPSLLRNSIVWSGNANLTQSGFTGTIGNLQVRHSLVKGEDPAGAGNLDGTVSGNRPRFVSPSDSDFRMLTCSPTVNEGNNSYISETSDILKNARVFQTTVDMGAYELQRNASSSCATPNLPSCANLSAPGPVDGATNVSINTIIHWDADPNATGYILRVGTALGLRDLVDEVLGNQTSYTLSNLPENAPIFVRIVPFNGQGNAPSCSSESFTTESIIGLASCAYLTSPANEDSIVPANLGQIQWNAVANADGYRVTISGSTSTANNETNLVVNGTSHPFANNFTTGETVTVSIRPFNANGITSGCGSETFIIESAAPMVPSSCSDLVTPANGATNVAVDVASITWDAVADATGYRVSISGSSSTANNITDQNITGTTHPFANDFDNDETVTVTIIPFNAQGDAVGCATPQSFTIEAGVPTTDAFVTTWKTDNPGPSDDNTITIPTFGSGYNYSVDWGDSNTTTGETGDASHTYATPGTYTVTITGTFPRIYFNNGGDKEKLLTVEQWGTNPWVTMNRAFYGCINLNITNASIDNPDLSSVTDLDQMFRGCTNFNGDVTNWDISNVETIDSMFREAIAFNQNIGSWNTSSLTSLNRVFQLASGFNQNIDNWDVSNVIGMALTFDSATSFNQPLNSWNVENVQIFLRTFQGATSFDLPLDNWDTSSATSMDNMFSETIFNQDISGWDVSNVEFLRSMFQDATVFNQDISGWDTSSCTDMLFMFQGATAFNQDISGWDVSQVTRVFAMFENATAFDQDLSSWNVENVTTAERMFDGITLSTANYDALLIGWNAQDLQPNVLFSGGNSQYCAGETARMNMITSDTWTITDGGTASPTVNDLADQNQVNSYTLPAITGTQLTGAEAYYTETNGGGTSYDAGDIINFADFPSYPITLYIYDGSGTCASEESFALTLTSAPTVPSSCADLVTPASGATGVAVNLASITWDAVADATGYRVSVSGSTSTANNITNQNITGTMHPFANSFDNDETVTVTIIPFNAQGDAVGCATPQSFTIESAAPSTDAFITTWKTDNPGLSDDNSIRIPTDGLLTYNYTVDWGDSTPITTETNAAMHTYAAPGTYTVTIRGIFPRIVFDNGGDADKLLAIEQWGDIQWSSMKDAFSGCANMVGNFTDRPDLSGVSDMRSMFHDCELFNTNINDWDVSTVTTMDQLFNDALLFNQPLNNWDVTNVTSMSRMFDAAIAFNQPLDLWNVSNVSNMARMFNDAIAFNRDIGGWVTTNLEFTSSMFRGAIIFNQNIGNWNTSSVVDMSQMFNNASNFDQNIGTWDVSMVTNMSNMFSGVTLSTANYDALLIGWDALDLQPNVLFSGGNSQYCAGETARMNMITSDTWTITDGGTASPTVNDLADQNQVNSYTLPAITGTQLTGAEAYYTQTNGGGTSYDAGDIINFADFPSYPITLYIYDGSGTCASEESFALTLTSAPTVPSSCADLNSPTNGATNVAVDVASITWDAVADATGYRVTISGSTSTANNITDQNITGTTHPFANNFDNDETVTVTIIPFNAQGDAVGCATPQTFTIESSVPTVPSSCADLVTPANGATGVAVNLASITWDAVADATGYRVTISGSTSTANNITDQNITGTTHPFANNFDNDETVTVTIIPFNAQGDAVGCATPQTFTIESSVPTVPSSCADLVTPANGATNVEVNTNLSWDAVVDADGYRLRVGTSPGGSDILADEDVGILTSYMLMDELPENTTIYVLIIPYNAQGDAVNCTEQSFTTTEVIIPEDESLYGFSPDGDGINEYWEIVGIENHPENTVTIFNRWGDAVFQIQNYDNNVNVFRGEANRLTKLGAGSLPSGTYFFDIQINGEHNLTKLRGYLVLKR